MPIELSVIIPCHNHARFLGQAIASAISQQGCDVEVVVVDDHSSDDPAAVVAALADPRVSLIHLTDRTGISAGRNLGLSLATHEYIGFLDADDVWPTDRTHSLLQEMNDGCAAAYGSVVEFTEELRLQRTVRPGEHPYFCAGSSLFPRVTFDQVGWFDEGLGSAEFIDFGSRLTDRGHRIARSGAVTLHRRVHRANVGRGRRVEARSNYLTAVRRHMQRVRDTDVTPVPSTRDGRS